MPGPDSLLLGVRRGERTPCDRGARLDRWVRVPRLWLRGRSPPPRGVGGRGSRVAAACAHARPRTRRVRVRARAPRLQPRARSRLRGHSRLLGAAVASPRPEALSAGPEPLSRSQEDELEEDAWAREYRGGGGEPGACSADGRQSRASPLPAGGSKPGPGLCLGPWPRPVPLPAPTAGREGRRGRAPVSEGAGAGREQPLVRLETVVTATGFRSSVTRVWGGDTLSQPSPTPCGASAPSPSGRGDYPSYGWGGGLGPLGPFGCAGLHNPSRVGVGR